ncbi:Leader peptidase [Streptococcus pneumoniae]|nr:Leader peptidase [Streptococcus pneumoniae]
MKNKRYFFDTILIILLLISTIFCVSPVFIKLDILGTPSHAILTFVLAIPLFYILSQCLHTLLLLVSSIFCKLRPIYFYFIFVIIIGARKYYRILFHQLMGFSPGIAVFYKESQTTKNLFKFYYFLYFTTLISYYFFFTFVYDKPLLLPLISFSIIIALVQKLYRIENQQLFLLKSHEIWKLQSKSELPCVALSYISLIKPYLSESVREQIDLLEVKRFKKINNPISLYGMLDVIKLNLYLRHYNEKNKYESMLKKILEVRPDFVLIEQNIDDSLNSSQPLSLSLAISEIQLLLEVYIGIKHVSIRR